MYEEFFTRGKKTHQNSDGNTNDKATMMQTDSKIIIGHTDIKVSPNRPRQLKEITGENCSCYRARAAEMTATSKLNQIPTKKTNISTQHIAKKIKVLWCNIESICLFFACFIWDTFQIKQA